MSIDFDKLTKLIALANNNPNENEANSAARMACKMLANVRFRHQPESEPEFNVRFDTSFDIYEMLRRAQAAVRQPEYKAVQCQSCQLRFLIKTTQTYYNCSRCGVRGHVE